MSALNGQTDEYASEHVEVMIKTSNSTAYNAKSEDKDPTNDG